MPFGLQRLNAAIHRETKPNRFLDESPSGFGGYDGSASHPVAASLGAAQEPTAEI
ncbi:hypothetical protein KO516_08190 [Citreicella sp. C3M06]|uniref:hypothetical protein n=1 Tax=Citreicella sp. C3M06 TaxID=2841564 RepID=UPI001C09869B|nr:hypothetical protein [Citreicella sp. C3M06]MBU2960793.1 hypothetical protein [Citreicella sp. C3M06]